MTLTLTVSLCLFFFSHYVVELLVCLGSLSSCMTQFRPCFSCLTDRIMFDSSIQSSSWSTQWLHGDQVLWLQKSKKNPNHHLFTVGIKCLCWYALLSIQTVHYSQRAPLWCHLFKCHCSRSLVLIFSLFGFFCLFVFVFNIFFALSELGVNLWGPLLGKLWHCDNTSQSFNPENCPNFCFYRGDPTPDDQLINCIRLAPGCYLQS